MKKKPDDNVALWARVPAKHIERIERALPKYGWRVAVMRDVVEHLASTLKPGSTPSMHTMKHLAREAADQYAHDVDRKKSRV